MVETIGVPLAGWVGRNIVTALRRPAIARRWLRWSLQRSIGCDVTLSIAGSRFGGFPNFNAYLGAWQYQPPEEELRFIQRSLSGAENIVDVGANFGVLAAAFAGFAPTAKIYAFEPHPETATALRRNLARNLLTDQIEVLQSAVGNCVGEVRFSNGPSAAANHILATAAADTLCVPITTLDRFTADNNISEIDFLKIDVEGADVDVLFGAEALFKEKRIRYGMIEVCPGNLSKFGRSTADLAAFFLDVGYEIQIISDVDFAGVSVGSARLPPGYLGNAAFWKL